MQANYDNKLDITDLFDDDVKLEYSDERQMRVAVKSQSRHLGTQEEVSNSDGGENHSCDDEELVI